MKRSYRGRVAVTGWLIVIALGLGLWPQPSAAVRGSMTLTDKNEEWSAGKFFRTGLAATDPGGVQLVPLKVQNQWTSDPNNALPRELNSHSSVTYHDRIFVIGGNTFFDATTPNPDDIDKRMVKSDAVFATKLADGQTGTLQPWTTLPSLPIALSDAASVVVEAGSNRQAYLVVIGGQRGRTPDTMTRPIDDVTTSRIFYYPIVETNGVLDTSQAWREIADAERLPTDANFSETTGALRGGGARSLSAVAVTVGGNPYIYTFGGENTTYDGSDYTHRILSGVNRAAVTINNGNLSLTWNSAALLNGDIQYRPSPGMIQKVPLAGAATVTYTSATTNKTGVYLIGGLRCLSGCDGNGMIEQEDANAYVATIDGTTGDLAWLDLGNMSETRSGHDAVQSKGEITIIGGSANSSSPTTTGALGLIKDDNDLNLYRPDNSAANFELQVGVLKRARMLHSMETLNSPKHGDWAYVIGGKVETSSGVFSDASNEVLVGDLDSAPLDSGEFVSNGKYYSPIYNFGTGAKYYGVNWKALIGSGQAIDIQFLAGNNPQNLTALATRPSINGSNSFDFGTPPTNGQGQFFQFIATFNSSISSPILDSMTIDLEVRGAPNLRVVAGGASIAPNPIHMDDKIQPTVTIINKDFDAQHPALPANWDRSGGSFFVDLYVIPPGQTPAQPSLGQTGVAYAEVAKSWMDVDKSYTIPASAWRPSSCGVPPCPAVNWNTFFTASGTYNLYVMVDSIDVASDFGNVREADEPGTFGESDNVYGPFTVQVSAPAIRYYMPIAFREGRPLAPPQIAPEPLPRVHTLDGSR